jgi:hypothetical protein
MVFTLAVHQDQVGSTMSRKPQSILENTVGRLGKKTAFLIVVDVSQTLVRADHSLPRRNCEFDAALAEGEARTGQLGVPVAFSKIEKP